MEEHVEVFRTTVATPAQAAGLIAGLQRRFPACRITFDLDDCDKVLRMAGPLVCPQAVGACLAQAGYECTPLE